MRGPGFEVPGCAPAGTMVVLALRVLAEPTNVPGRRAVASGLCALDVCCPSLGLCAFDVNRTRDAIPVYTLLCGTAVLPCPWA